MSPRAIAGQESESKLEEAFRTQVIFPGGKGQDIYLFVFYGAQGQVVKIWRPRRPDRAGSQDMYGESDYAILGELCTCPGFEHHTYCKHIRFATLAREAWKEKLDDIATEGVLGSNLDPVFDLRKFPDYPKAKQ